MLVCFSMPGMVLGSLTPGSSTSKEAVSPRVSKNCLPCAKKEPQLQLDTPLSTPDAVLSETIGSRTSLAIRPYLLGIANAKRVLLRELDEPTESAPHAAHPAYYYRTSPTAETGHRACILAHYVASLCPDLVHGAAERLLLAQLSLECVQFGLHGGNRGHKGQGHSQLSYGRGGPSKCYQQGRPA